MIEKLGISFCRALADTDADGRMNVNEFSIACKLINLKLRGFEVPKTLPPTLVTSLVAAGGTPTRTPTAMSPVTQVVVGPPPVPPQPTIMQHHQQQAVHIPPGRPAMPPQPQILQQAAAAVAAQIPPAIPPQPAIAMQQNMAAAGAIPGGIPGYAIPGNYVAQPQMMPG